jgi:hypothetical protein
MTGEFTPEQAVVAIPFSKANAVTNAANVDLVLAGGNTLMVMPKAGSVVGLAVHATADLTAGSATVKVHKAGTEYPDASAITLTLNDTNQKSHGAVRRGALTFAAGDTLGVSYSSTTDMAPTDSNDIDAVLFVAFDND